MDELSTTKRDPPPAPSPPTYDIALTEQELRWLYSKLPAGPILGKVTHALPQRTGDAS